MLDNRLWPSGGHPNAMERKICTATASACVRLINYTLRNFIEYVWEFDLSCKSSLIGTFLNFLNDGHPLLRGIQFPVSADFLFDLEWTIFLGCWTSKLCHVAFSVDLTIMLVGDLIEVAPWCPFSSLFRFDYLQLPPVSIS